MRLFISIDDSNYGNVQHNNSWKGKVYSRHGGIHSSWWVQNRKDKIVLQGVDINLMQDVFPEHFQCAVYIRKKKRINWRDEIENAQLSWRSQ